MPAVSAYDASTSTMLVAHAQAVIDTNLTQQGKTQLQTYRDWITLMQKYGANASWLYNFVTVGTPVIIY